MYLRRSGFLALLFLVALFVVACGGDDDDDDASGGGDDTTATVMSDDGGSGSASGGDGCHVDVTGDIETSWDGPDDLAAVGTDYWYSNEELQQQAEFFSDEDVDVDALIENGDVVLVLLLINCTGDTDNSVSFSVSNATTRNDLAFGPGSYPIRGGLFSADEPAGTFNALLSIDEASIIWGVGDGTFEITRWDHSRLEGSFEFPASESLADSTPRAVEVAGTFSFSCKTSSSCG